MTVYPAMKTEGTTVIADVASMKQSGLVNFPWYINQAFPLTVCHLASVKATQAVAHRLKIKKG
jgi:hypothetical protein